jgi:hypothetical protein
VRGQKWEETAREYETNKGTKAGMDVMWEANETDHTCSVGPESTSHEDESCPKNQKDGDKDYQKVALGEERHGKRHGRGVLLRWLILNIRLGECILLGREQGNCPVIYLAGFSPQM